jgi:uncharacterized protein (TIGR03067 family)
MQIALMLGLGLGLLPTPSQGEDDLARKIVGSYTIVEGEKAGKKIPPERIEGAGVRITRDTFTTQDKDSQEIYVANYELDLKKTPCVITMRSLKPEAQKGTVAKGVIKVEGEFVWLCYSHDDGAIPTTFQTKEGSKQNCFKLKRMPAESTSEK